MNCVLWENQECENTDHKCNIDVDIRGNEQPLRNNVSQHIGEEGEGIVDVKILLIPCS